MSWWTNLESKTRTHLANLRVAVYGSGGAPSHHLALIALWGGQPRVISAEEIAQGGLSNFDAVIFPGGGLRAMAGQLSPLGERGISQLRQWVTDGGTYIGTCAGSCHPLKMSEPYVKSLPISAHFQMCDLAPVNAAAGDWGLDSPGTGRIRVAAEDSPLMEGLSGDFEIVHYNGPLFPSEPGTAGRVLGATENFTAFEISAGLGSATTLEHALSENARIAYRQPVGEGQIILFGSHPEFGASVLQLGWLPASRLLANALNLVPARGRPQPQTGQVTAKVLRGMEKEALELQKVVHRLAPLGQDFPKNTPPFLGYAAPQLWQAAITETDEVLERLRNWLPGRPTGELPGAFLLDTEPQPDQDFGFAGTRQLLRRALEMAQKAESVQPSDLPAITGPYNEFLTHPYHLVASVYLSAGGLVAGAALQATAFAALNALSEPHIVPITA